MYGTYKENVRIFTWKSQAHGRCLAAPVVRRKKQKRKKKCAYKGKSIGNSIQDNKSRKSQHKKLRKVSMKFQTFQTNTRNSQQMFRISSEKSELIPKQFRRSSDKIRKGTIRFQIISETCRKSTEKNPVPKMSDLPKKGLRPGWLIKQFRSHLNHLHGFQT